MSQEIIWRKLRTPYGPAGMVPRLVAKMSKTGCLDGSDMGWEDGSNRRDACSELAKCLLSPGEWTTASAPTVSLLLDAKRGIPEYVCNLSLAASITAGVGLDYWVRRRRGDTPKAYQEACFDAIAERKSSVLKLLEDPRDEIRAAAAYLLSVVPPLRREALAALEARWDVESVGFTRACLLQALEELDNQERWTAIAQKTVLVGRTDQAVLGMAALISLRSQPDQTGQEIVTGLSAWLHLPEGTPEHPMSIERPDGSPEAMLAVLLGVEFERYKDETVELLIRLGSEPWNDKTNRRIEFVINHLVGFSWDQEVIATSELTPLQRRLAEGLVDAPIYRDRGWMPPPGRPRKMWLRSGSGG